MAMANMNLIGVFVTKLWPVQTLACGGGGGDFIHNLHSVNNCFGRGDIYTM